MSKKGFKSEGTKTTTNAEATRLVDLGKDEVTKLTGQLVPVLQINSGPDQGKILTIGKEKECLLGRSQTCEMVVHDTSCSRRHARVFRSDDDRIFIEDLGSTNGTKINGKRVDTPHALQDGDNILLGDNTRIRFSMTLEQDAQVAMDVYFRATRDSLTRAFNRKRFEESLQREIAFMGRGQSDGLGLILFDVDHFKKVNDTHGHPAGDAVLREIGLRVPELIRKEDLFARIGGEEFAIITRSESIDGLKILVERMRADFEALEVEHEGKKLKFTISLGVAYVAKGQKVPEYEDFVGHADEAMYEAKEGGRNRFCVRVFPLQSAG